MVITILEQNGFHPRTQEEYIIKGGVQTKRVVRDIFFMSDKQIHLTRHFVSGFIYKTDATFNTNTRRLPLSVIVGIDNTGHTFPMAFMFITSKSLKSFQFTNKCLTELCFYNCPQLTLICGDFSKGLRAAVALKVKQELALALKGNKDGFVNINEIDDIKIKAERSAGAQEFLEGEIIVIKVKVGTKGEKTHLQLCEQHTIKAIKKRLIHSRRYSKETQLMLVNLLNKWIKAPNLEALKDAQKTLLSRLHFQERDYLQQFYQPKEPQFYYIYTRSLLNLGVNLTQRGESYHVIIKVRLNKNLSISATCEAIIAKTKKLAKEYNEQINEN